LTHEQLIAALQDECQADRIKVEDFLNAISDLCIDELKKGRSFHVGDLGFVALNPRLSRKGKGFRAAVIFQSSKKLRKRLGVPDEKIFLNREPGLCKKCGLRPRKVRVFHACDPCLHARMRSRSQPTSLKS
jgi:nucleoid DNA-binding protein